MLKFGLLGRGAGAPPPLVIDDYIFYEMKNFPALPERFVEDTGVSGEVAKRSQPRSTQYDGRLFSSDFLALSPTITVDVPLVHTVDRYEVELTGDGKLEVPVASTSAELFDGFTTQTLSGNELVATYTETSINGFDLAVTTVGTLNYTPTIRFNTLIGSYAAGDLVTISFDAIVNSGTANLDYIKFGNSVSVNVNHTVTNGKNIIQFTMVGTRLEAEFLFNGQQLFDVGITNLQTYVVQSVEGTMLYWDADAGKHVQIAGDSGLGSENKVVNGDFSDGTTGWNLSGDWLIANEELNGSLGGAGDASQFNLHTVDKRYQYSIEQRSKLGSGVYAWKAGGNSAYLPIDGINTGIVIASPDVLDSFRFRLFAEFGGIVDNVSLKQILDLSTVHTFENQKIGHFVSLSAGQYFTEADIALIDADRGLLKRWGNDDLTTGLSLVKVPEDTYYEIVDGSPDVGGLPLVAPYEYSTIASLPDNSYFTRFDFATQQWLTMSATGDVGENIIINGDFEDGTTDGWNSTQQMEVIGGQLVVTNIDGVTTRVFADSVHTEIGKRYRTSRYSDPLNSVLFTHISGASNIVYEPIDGYGSAIITASSSPSMQIGGTSNLGSQMITDDIELVELLPIASTIHLDSPCKDAFPHDAPLTDEDLVALNDDPNLIYDVVYNGYILPSGFSVANMVGGDTSVGLTPMFYPMTEGVAGGAFVQNVLVPILETLPINGYLESARTSLINQRVGSVETRTEKDASGRLVGTVAGQWLQFTGKGDYVDTGIVVDGSLTDFSMLFVFEPITVDGTRLVVDSGASAGNAISIWQDTVGNVTMQIGRFVSGAIPVPSANYIAVLVNFNSVTSELQYSFNGVPLPVASPIIFDGVTSSTVKLGRHESLIQPSWNWNKKLGLGFLKAGLTSEAEWQDYWAEVQSIYTPNVKILRINELQSGYCDLAITNPCVATSQHQVIVGDATGALTYTWSSVGGTIASGQGTDTVEVTTDVGNNRGLNNEDATGHTYDTGSGAGNTIEIDPIVIGKFDIHQESQGSDPYYPRVDLINDNHVIGQGYEAIVSVEVTGTCILQRFEIGTESGVNQFDVVDELMTDEIRQWHFPAAYFRSGGRWSISFNGQDEFNFDAVAYLSFRKILEGGEVEPDITFALTCNVDDTLTQDSLAVQVTHNRSPS